MKLWVEIVTGQNNLNYVQSKIYDISPMCRFCLETDETFYHYLTECPALLELRATHSLTWQPKIDDWKNEKILKFAEEGIIHKALSFEQPQFLELE